MNPPLPNSTLPIPALVNPLGEPDADVATLMQSTSDRPVFTGEPGGRPTPLRVLFMLTSMPIGGAETLLANLMRKMNPGRFSVELCCLKELGPLGEELAASFPTHSHLLSNKYDLRVLPRLIKRLRDRVDAVVTVGAGDKMFWGRLAGHLAGTPVVLSALHSTGWPDGIGRLNRCLTAWTDGFIAVAPDHGRYLIEQEKLPSQKVFVIPNGVDTRRFQFDAAAAFSVRQELNIPVDAPVCGIIAALRPEKNHRLFLQVSRQILDRLPAAHFLVVGDGEEGPGLRAAAQELNLGDRMHFLGSRSDIPRLLSAFNLFCLTSHNEANPVSILEALSVRVPVVATDVGSVSATVIDGQTGFLAPAGDAHKFAERALQILTEPKLAEQMGEFGRDQVVRHWSVERMVRGYEQLITAIYDQKRRGPGAAVSCDGVGFCGAAP
ncbi:MAG: glycosyltransferase [Planctomycetales bacterium]|nr:glycosyltransferase [Planctomycetales bacterium]